MSTQTKDPTDHAEENVLSVGAAPSGARSANRWLVALVIALTVAVVALSAALVNQSTSEEVSPPVAVPTQAVAPGEANQLADSPEFLAAIVGEAVPADPEMVALVDEFIADYDATRPRTVTSSPLWGPDSVLWADNAYLSPEGLGPPLKTARSSDVVQFSPGPFSDRELLASPAPIWVAFEVRWGSQYEWTWIQEWTPDGDVVLAMWVIH